MVEIRRLGEADRGPWAAMRAALWPEQEAAALEAELTEFLADTRMAGFGAFEGAHLAGFSEVSEREWGDEFLTKPVGWLEAVYVAPDFRRAGVGRRLAKAAEDWARARGLREFGSDALIDNRVSIAAHAAWGFAEVQRIVTFRKTLT